MADVPGSPSAVRGNPGTEKRGALAHEESTTGFSWIRLTISRTPMVCATASKRSCTLEEIMRQLRAGDVAAESDAQKFFVLQLRKGLIEDGLFARIRNPNYLGEVVIYSGFALASWHWQPFVVLAGWFLYLVRNMRRKDESMYRHPEFAAYKHRTGMFLPSLGMGSTRPRPAQQVSATSRVAG
jgi:hypothetical protein